MIDLILKAMRERPYSFKKVPFAFGTDNSNKLIDTKTGHMFEVIEYRSIDYLSYNLRFKTTYKSNISNDQEDNKKLFLEMRIVFRLLDDRDLQVQRNKLILDYS